MVPGDGPRGGGTAPSLYFPSPLCLCTHRPCASQQHTQTGQQKIDTLAPERGAAAPPSPLSSLFLRSSLRLRRGPMARAFGPTSGPQIGVGGNIHFLGDPNIHFYILKISTTLEADPKHGQCIVSLLRLSVLYPQSPLIASLSCFRCCRPGSMGAATWRAASASASAR